MRTTLVTMKLGRQQTSCPVLPVWLFLALMLSLDGMVSAENIVFPPDAGIKNVKDYGAKGDGVTDDTQAIQKAIDEVKGIPDTLYFPNGTYLLSNGVGIFKGKAHSRDRFLVYQGQSEVGTVIKLKDNCPGFEDPQKPKIVMSVYEGQGTGDAMRGYVRNLTVDVGSGKPGAVGLRFMANNSGAMDYVTIRSSDPKKVGRLGLDLTQGQVGPCFIKHVTVIGFDYGVEVAHTFSVVLEHLTLQHQNVLGFFNSDGRTTLRGFKSVNRVPAIRNKWMDLTLIGAELTGGAPESTAIINENARMFLRGIKQSGYGHLLQEAGGLTHDGAALDEWYEGKAHALFGVEPKTLRLPIRETPEVSWETDLSKWVKVPWSKHGEDIGEALQGAIDLAAKEGKTTVYFPRHARTYEYPKFTRPIRVHGSVNRMIGMENIVDIADSTGRLQSGEHAVFTFENLTSPVVVVERFFLLGGWEGPRTMRMFENKSGKTVVIRNLGHAGLHKKPAMSGEWFIEDVPAVGLQIGPGEKCWARQFNPESAEADMIEVDGGQLWILGLKTEGRATHIIARNGAKVELLGGVSYQSWDKQPLDPPMFKVTNSDASFTFGFYHWNMPFTTVVEETVGTETKTLLRKELTDYHLPCYRASGDRLAKNRAEDGQ